LHQRHPRASHARTVLGHKHGDAVAGVKMLVGAVLGKQFDDGEVGNLKP
jgi:hypothetical protein